MTSPQALEVVPQAADAGQVRRMDRMYGLQRHVYDLTRKYYLFGRDRLIARLPVAPGQRIAEIGCGTGRNLALLARRHPQAHFCGIDAAHVMLDSARAKIRRHRLDDRVRLRQGLAEDLSARAWFAIDAFDRIYFSYSLSMIPTWPAAIETALANLAPGGELWSVDFWDLGGFPKVCAVPFRKWLALFHVHFRPELLAYFEHLQRDGRGRFLLEPVGLRYAYLARFIKAA